MINKKSCRGNEGTRRNWHQVPYLGKLKRFFYGWGWGFFSTPFYLFSSFSKICFTLQLSFNIRSQNIKAWGSTLSGFALKRRPIKHLLNLTQEPNTLCVGVLMHAHWAHSCNGLPISEYINILVMIKSAHNSKKIRGKIESGPRR